VHESGIQPRIIFQYQERLTASCALTPESEVTGVTADFICRRRSTTVEDEFHVVVMVNVIERVRAAYGVEECELLASVVELLFNTGATPLRAL